MQAMSKAAAVTVSTAESTSKDVAWTPLFPEVPELTLSRLLFLIVFAFTLPPLFFGFVGYKSFQPKSFKPWLKPIVRGLAISLIAPLASFLFLFKSVNKLIIFWAMVAPAVGFVMSCLLSIGIGYALARYKFKRRKATPAV